MTKVLDAYAAIINFVIILLMYALLFAVALQIAGRYVDFIPRYLWAEEVARMSLIWMIFLGSMIGIRERRHFYVDFLPKNMPPVMDTILNIVYYVLLLGISYVFLRFGFRYFYMGTIQTSELTGINLGWIHASVPFAGFTWAIFLLEQAIRLLRGKHIEAQHEPEEPEEEELP